MTVHELLLHATEQFADRGIETARLDAEVLLAHALGVERADLILKRNEQLTDDQRERFEALVRERMRRRPVAQLTNRKEFWSREIYVDETVLTPRPETEGIIERALRCFSAEHPRTLLDICTGSGCIAAALADAFPHAHITATDISEDALAVARRNLSFAQDRVELLSGDLFEVFERPHESTRAREYDLIVSNPPYIPEHAFEALPPEVRDFEPRIALAAGADGLAFLRRIAQYAPRYLAPGGWLIVEVGIDQAAAVEGMLVKQRALTNIAVDKDLAGIDRIVAAQKR